MKMAFISILVSFSSVSALACLQEAEVIAKIKSVEKTTSGACLAQVEPGQIRFFASSYACEMDLTELVSESIDIGVQADQSCRIQIGGEINGIVVRNSAGQLVLE